jgi:ricin-type beta-trefoil lectin protein
VNKLAIVTTLSILPLLGSLSGCATNKQVSNGNTNMCMNVEWHGYPVAGTPLKVKPCDPWRNQQWFFNKDASVTGVGGYCVDTQDGSQADGAQVLYVPCSGSPSQKWTVSGTQLVANGGKCVDVSGGEPNPLAPLVLATCNGSPTQQWQLH